MESQRLDYDALADRARCGEPEACWMLQRQLARHMVRIVRHALCNPHTASPLAPQIRAEARKVADPDWRPGSNTPESLIGAVAQSLCGKAMSSATGRSRDPQWAADTVTAA